MAQGRTAKRVFFGRRYSNVLHLLVSRVILPCDVIADWCASCLQVAREGTKKTVFTNFYDLCKSMNRSGDHVQQFLLAELGTSGNLDGQNRLIVKGRFLPKAFEGVLRRYMNE